jgi:isoleucyl-tRNA synthetase
MEEKEIKKSEVALREEAILKFWQDNNIFEKSLEKKSPKGEFVFYDGPPTANGKPGIHHLEPSSFKDLIPRYKTMRGYHVRRKRGWDTHGLPVELQVEKELGLKSKKEIEQYGIEAFNKKCKESVWKYVEEWKNFTTRIGFWVDYKNPYITYDNSYIESVWNVLKTVEEKKLLYKDYKVLPWCPRCGTALSSHELAQGYQMDKDLAVTVKFKVKGEENTYLLAWTTTPWTLPGNVALAAGEDIEYVKIKVENDLLILAKARLSIVEGQYEIIEELKGKDLVGLRYEPLYHFLANKFDKKDPVAFEKSYHVYAADFVNTEDGTGIVHTAVMYGQDDFVLGSAIGLPKHHLVKDDGHFADEMEFLSDRFVKDEEVAVDIIKDLAHRGLLFKKEKYEHSYPHCWRCKTPLIYYARDSWYIKMSALRDKLVSENKKIHWEPEHIQEGRFGEWLREIKDWAISRERYWGTPLPIWVNKEGQFTVIGGILDLKKHLKKSGNSYFVMRHGESLSNEKNVDSLVPGEENDALTSLGRDQVIVSAKNLKQKPDLIISSPFTRTKQTAEIIAEHFGLAKDSIVTYQELREYSATESPDENYNDVRKRIISVLNDIEKNYQNKVVLIVSHEYPLRALLSSFESLSKKEEENNFESKYPILENAKIFPLPFLPLPRNSDGEVDVHRPYIDEVLCVDEKGETLTRVKEVMDVWFDSGAMPFAQDNYPFSTKEILYPADYISEAIDQTRGWFYTLHAVGVLMDRGLAFKNVISLGHILDSQGKKMSKSVGNVVDPWTVMDKFGVDALRLWMYTVNQPGDSKNFDEKSVDELIKKTFNPILNIVAFYELYKGDKVEPHNKSKNILDKWILSRLSDLIESGTKNLDGFKVFEAARPIRDFVNDFSTWYIRRSRDRFKSDDEKERALALSTTSFVLKELSKYMAPFTPFFAEEIYQKIKSSEDEASVHLTDWPKEIKSDADLLSNMNKVREIVTKAFELRQKSGHKVRQPLAKLTIPEKFSTELLGIISDEVNVKNIEVKDGEITLDTVITKELKEEGVARDIIRGIQDLRKTEGLRPSQKINLVISTHDEIKSIIETFSDMIKSPTQIEKITYSEEGQKHKIPLDLGEVTVSILD